jgi:hypothetical protein
MRDSPLRESLSTFHAVVLVHATPACALAVATALTKRVCKPSPGLHFRRNQTPQFSMGPTLHFQYPLRPYGED